jgi:hypothetical protein
MTNSQSRSGQNKLRDPHDGVARFRTAAPAERAALRPVPSSAGMKRIAIDLEGLVPQERLSPATVHDVDDSGTVRIAFDRDAEPIVASIAVPLGGNARDLVKAGDAVLVLQREGDAPVIVSTIAKRLDDAKRPETIKLEAGREIVLECGEASITLQADGRIVVRGGHVESYAEGTNRIKGAQVRIN